MLLDAGRDGENVRIENDVILIEPDLIDENPVGPLTDADLLLISRRLAVFVEGHDHHRRAVTHDMSRLPLEILLALLERDRVHDPLPLQVFEALLKDFPLRGIHHDRYLRDIRLALEQLQETAHHRLAVDQAVVETNINDVRAVAHLLAGHLHRRLQVAGSNQLCELRGTRDIRALADHEEALVGSVVVGLRAGETEGVGNGFHLDEEFTAETQRCRKGTRRSQRDTELRGGIVDETLDAVGESDGMEVNQESEMVVGHSQVGEKLSRMDRKQRFNRFKFNHEAILH